MRTTLAEIPRQLAAELKALGWPPFKEPLPSDDEIRQITRELIAKRQAAAKQLLAKDILLFEPAGEARFWTSDHPVALHWQLPLGEVGLESLGVEIYLPIAADLLVGFVCPSHRSDTVGHLDGGVEICLPQAVGLERGLPLKISDAMVNFFNALQVEASERFLYASGEDFTLARKILAHRPDLAEPRGLVRAGKMGHAPPRSANLPPGEWLYLETHHDYLLIPIRDWSGGGRGEMTTDDLEQLAEALSREQFEVAHVFADDGGQMMRGARIERVEDGEPGRLRMVHADPSLAALDVAIAASRPVPT
ncbi:hypothetical protein AS593_06910 [Caulobacter vibrioides]|nr:hypothetical protein AS593_06910 [Caulobacter vibrioides]